MPCQCVSRAFADGGRFLYDPRLSVCLDRTADERRIIERSGSSRAKLDRTDSIGWFGQAPRLVAGHAGRYVVVASVNRSFSPSCDGKLNETGRFKVCLRCAAKGFSCLRILYRKRELSALQS